MLRNSCSRLPQGAKVPHFVLMLGVVVFLCTNTANSLTVAKPSASQAELMDYELGASIHFNMQTFNRSMRPGKSTNVWIQRHVKTTWRSQ